MKKLIIGALTAVAMLMGVHTAQAQAPAVNAAMDAVVPVDSAVIVGKLPNGLTYYIRHNETPKGQADFFIAQKVGSALEEDNQRGLAHFLEHMCFNGTKNFPGNTLIDWLETVGVKFGQNLNAYTSIDETVYNISSVPVQRTGVIDSCLLILHDWADDLLLDPTEIDKERGVIHQEWRRSMVGNMRLMEKLLPKVYPDNKYGERLPIGTMEVVDNFPPQAIRDYYEAWYRPDQQGIIVVGDIDPVYIENKIKEIFSPIEMPKDAKERAYLEVQDTPGTIYAIGTDPEMPYPVAMMFFKQKERIFDPAQQKYNMYYLTHYLTNMVATMLNNRLAELQKKPDCPYAQASVEIGNFVISKTKDALGLQVVGKGDDIRPAFEAAYRELMRAAKTGFTSGEYERAKAEYIANLEKQYGQRNGRENTSYAREYAQNFTNGDPIPGIGYELALLTQYSQMIPVQAINQVLPGMISNENRVVMGMLPENDKFHAATEAEMADLISKVEAEDLEAYRDEMKAEPLVENLPAPVAAKVSENKQWGATELVYPNGAKVIVKPTKFKDNEILFDATALGGLASTNTSAATAQYLPVALTNHGLGTYTSSDLEKYLQGKNANVRLGIDDYMRTLSGTTTPKDLKYLMELIYMNFRAFDINEDDFNSRRAMIEALLKNQEDTPQYKFGTGLSKSLYKAEAKQELSTATLAQANREETVALVHEMFNNPASFTFVFTGDINVDTLTALCNQYIGTLPASRVADVPYRVNPDFEPNLGAAVNGDETAMQTPQTWVAVTLTAKLPYDARNRALASISGQILANRLIKKIREEMGAVYSIYAQALLQRVGDQNFTLQIPFPMKPELKDEVLANIKTLVDDMAVNVTADEFNPIAEFMVKTAKEGLENNESWLNGISGAQLNGVDTFNGQAELIGTLTAADVMNFMKQALEQNNYRVYTLDPAK